MKEALPHLAVAYDQNIPEEVIATFRSKVADRRLNLRVEPQPSRGPQAGLEWLLPTVIVVFIAKAYFDGFLKEAGKDHYHLLKSGISWMWRSLVNTRVRPHAVTAGGKVIDDKYSLVLSLVAEANDGYRFKLLIANCMDDKQLDTAIRLFLEFLEAYHANRVDGTTAKELSEARVVGRMILMTYDVEYGGLRAVDPIQKSTKRT